MTMKRKKNVPKKEFLTEQVNSIIQNKYPVKCKCQDICGTFQNICHVELANPLTKRTLLVIWQIQDMFNTSRNKSSSLVLKPCKSVQKTNEEVFSLKLDRQLEQIYLSRFNVQFSTEAISIKNYEIQISRSVFHAYPSYLCRVSFLTTLDIYNDYFKGHQR